ncbi:hypothetical protein LEP1GSC058_0850 [Leptospira fainei serovar Hurstbridge str. BUT 6]|uniref:Uncharacterized protein n=1 Tax=Leptospira fainei serovar Hurstbridge str. BUT 6 TaxID=1193011 RepID=S3VWT1_9LEPT|nr:hypothetical protein [Leptospira fainei]EPG72577.1 hypothetical protein LEP1GSC058_0850 [Leptospira fainei serovar Hurstbridge str. BUT 6]
MEIFSLISNVFSIALAIISIWFAFHSIKSSEIQFIQTKNTLQEIVERSTKTETIVGIHFEKLMNTVLNIVNNATSSPEVKQAELALKEQENDLLFQSKIVDIINSILSSGDPKKLDEIIEALHKLKRLSN